MAAQIWQTNKRVRNGQQTKDKEKKKKERMVKKRGKKERKHQQHFLSASNGIKAGYT